MSFSTCIVRDPSSAPIREVEISSDRAPALITKSFSPFSFSEQNGQANSDASGAICFRIAVFLPTISEGTHPSASAAERFARIITFAGSCTTIKSLIASKSSTHCLFECSIREKSREFSSAIDACPASISSSLRSSLLGRFEQSIRHRAPSKSPSVPVNLMNQILRQLENRESSSSAALPSTVRFLLAASLVMPSFRIFQSNPPFRPSRSFANTVSSRSPCASPSAAVRARRTCPARSVNSATNSGRRIDGFSTSPRGRIPLLTLSLRNCFLRDFEFARIAIRNLCAAFLENHLNVSRNLILSQTNVAARVLNQASRLNPTSLTLRH